MQQSDRVIHWHLDSTAHILSRLHAADGFPVSPITYLANRAICLMLGQKRPEASRAV